MLIRNFEIDKASATDDDILASNYENQKMSTINCA